MDELYRTQLFESAMRVAGLKTPRFFGKRFSLVGFEEYMSEVFNGAHRLVTSEEMVKPKDPRARGELMLPDAINWPRLAFLNYVANLCRKDLPVLVPWVWRPPWLNEAVGSEARNSAHIDCCAMDLDLSSEEEVDRVLRDVLHPIYNAPAGIGNAMGIGVGAKRIHVDFFSPAWEEKNKRQRWWAYASRPTYLGPKHAIV